MKPHITKFIRPLMINLVLLLVFTSAATSQPASVIQSRNEDIDTAITKGFEYIATQINEDGGVRWADGTSSVAATIRAVQALAAAGLSQDFLVSDMGNHPIDYLVNEGMIWVNQEEKDTPGFSAARAGQLLTAVAAANQNPHVFGDQSTDLIYEINLVYDPAGYTFGSATPDNVTDQVWAIIGLAANNASVPVEAVDWLASVQSEDGSWNDGYGSFLDTTPLGILALVGSNHYSIQSNYVQSAFDYIAAHQQPDGGWQTEWDTATNANTTGVILQALSVIGKTGADPAWQQPDGNPLTALLSIQQENGAFGGEFANAFSTADAIIGLTGRNITGLGFHQLASEAFDFLLSIQEENGGWGSVGQTIDVMLAFRSAGWLPDTVTSSESNPMDFISANLESYIATGPDTVGKAIIGITAAGFDPTDFNDADLSQSLMATYDETVQAFGSPDNTWHQAFGILGLYAAGQEIPRGAVDALISLQGDDGGWEYTPGFGTSPDNTSIAIQALLAAGYTKQDPAIIRALGYLEAGQTENGGWGDASTTSYALMALNVLQEPLDSWITDSGVTPLANLFSYQKANGAFVFSWDFPDDNVMSTASALMALLGGDYLNQSRENISEHYAAVVIDPGDGAAKTACVPFGEESISGLDLLEKSGFNFEVEDGFIHSILDITNQEGETNYWSYWVWDGREWAFQNSGAGESLVLPGKIEAWHFTSWDLFPSLPPKLIPNLDEICSNKILTDFSQQPFLGWNDVFRPMTQPSTEIIPEGVKAKQAGIRSPFPLFIIGGAAIGLFILLGFFFLKKRQ